MPSNLALVGQNIDFKSRRMIPNGKLSTVLLDLTLANNESTVGVDAVWPRAPRAHCWTHKVQNLHQKMAPSGWTTFRYEVIDMGDATTMAYANERLDGLLSRYRDVFPEVCWCLKDDREASLSHLIVPPCHRQQVRAVNRVERNFVEIRRRTKVIHHLWDDKQLIKLLFASLMQVNERWSKSQYSDLELAQVRQLRAQMHSDEKVSETPLNPRRTRRSVVQAA